jgi:hypothetical protein
MSVVPKAEPEAESDATTNPPFPSPLISDRTRQSVDRPQSQPDLEQGSSPSRADTLFVLTWIAAIAAAAGFIIFAALANL